MLRLDTTIPATWRFSVGGGHAGSLQLRIIHDNRLPYTAPRQWGPHRRVGGERNVGPHNRLDNATLKFAAIVQSFQTQTGF